MSTPTLIPKRLAILKALTAHLQLITPANGYAYDLSQSVFRGKSVFSPDSSPIPMLSLLENGKPDVGNFAGGGKVKYAEEWSLLLQGFAENDQDNPTDPAYYLHAVVSQHLIKIVEEDSVRGRPVYPEFYRLGGLIADLYVGPPVVRPPDNQVSSTAFFYLPLRVGFQTDITNPYA